MDDGGQRLLDVIEDTHVLETFLRENFSNTALEESSRFDHGNISTENILAPGAPLDSFIYDGQMVDSLRAGTSHPSHHSHQLSPHIIQGVLHPPNLSSPASSHQLHSHHVHQNHHLQQHHLSQSHVLQHHSSHHNSPVSSHIHPNHSVPHPSLFGSNLDSDCIVKSRDQCSIPRNESDHSFNHLLASAGNMGSSQHRLQFQPQLPASHPQSHLQTMGSHTQQLIPSQNQVSQVVSHHPTSSLHSTISVPLHHHSQSQHKLHSAQSIKSHHSSSHLSTDSSSVPLGMSSVLASGISSASNSSLNLHSQSINSNNQENSSSLSKYPVHGLNVALPSPSNISPINSTVEQIQNSTQKSIFSVSTNQPVTSSINPFPASSLLSNFHVSQSTSTTSSSCSLHLINNSTSSHISSSRHIQSIAPNAQVLSNNINSVTPSSKSSNASIAVTSSYSSPSDAISSTTSHATKKFHASSSSVVSSSTVSASAPAILSPQTNHKSSGSSLPKVTSPLQPNILSPTQHSLSVHHTKSPNVSPHSNKSKSPARSHSPAPISNLCASVSNTSHSISTSNAQLISSKLLHSLVPNIVPHLPSQVCANGGLVISHTGSSVAVTPPVKQVVPSGQVIQLVSSQNGPCRQPIASLLPKPIQPKQPQLLPKPSPQGRSVRQSTPPPPPPGKTFISSRPTPPNSQQQIVLGAGAQPTVISGQPNIGSFVLNSSLLQPGIQQPLLIPQPNGVQLLVRPVGQSSGNNGQALLVPVPSQPQGVTSLGKSSQPPALVIPGSGQAPALVLPQGLTPTLGGTSVLGASQPRPAAQPLLRFVAPQAPLQLQQINTPSGPMFVAVPVGQTTLSLPSTGMFAASNQLRPLTPQVTPGTLQIAANPINLSQLQLAPSSLQVSANQPFSSQYSIPSLITTTPKTTSETVAVVTTNATQINVPNAKSPGITNSSDKNLKKKSKKKKKDKESKEESEKGKAVPINLNELLKETGIFDENEFSNLGLEENPCGNELSTSIIQQEHTPAATSTQVSSFSSPNSDKISSGNPQLLINSFPNSIIQNSTGANVNILNLGSGNIESQSNSSSSLPLTNASSNMCITLDPSGKLVLSDASKPQFNPIANSLQAQLQSCGLQLIGGGNASGISPAYPIVINGGDGLRISSSKGSSIPTLSLSSTASPIFSTDSVNISAPKSTGSDLMKKLLLDHQLNPPLFSVVGNTLQPVVNIAPSTSESEVTWRVPKLEKSAVSSSLTVTNDSSNSASSIKLISQPSFDYDHANNADSKHKQDQRSAKKKSKKHHKKDSANPDDHSPLLNLSVGQNNSSKDASALSNSFSVSSLALPNGDVDPALDSVKTKRDSIPSSLYFNASSGQTNPSVSSVLIAVTSNSIVSTISSSTAKLSSATSHSLPDGSKSSMVPLVASTQTNSAARTAGSGFVIQPGHQVKQLLLSAQNQEALKRVHNQIQVLQSKRGPLRDEDKALQQSLILEYKKIIATGTPISVSHSINQTNHSLPSSISSNSVMYSHSVGHKKILFSPNPKKSQISKRNSSSSPTRHSSKPKESGRFCSSSSSSVNSSQTSSIHSSSSVVAKSAAAADAPLAKPTSARLSAPPWDEGGVGSASSDTDSPRSGSSMPLIVGGAKSPASSGAKKSHGPGGAKNPATAAVTAGPQNAPSSGGPVSSRAAPPTSHCPTGASSPPGHVSSSAASQTAEKAPSFSLPLTRDQLFEHQLRTDQNGAMFPDYRSPFRNRTDAAKRLVRYHVYADERPTRAELAESDAQLELHSEALLRKTRAMKYKYQSLLLKDSLRRHASSETVMLYRMFIQEEKQNLERQKSAVSAGRELKLPPLPAHWFKGGPSPPVSVAFPWEEEWAEDKAFSVSRRPESAADAEGADVATTTPPRAESASPSWEMEEGRLEIMVEEESGANKGVHQRRQFQMNGQSRTSSPADHPCPTDYTFDQLEAEIQEEYVDDRLCMGSRSVASSYDGDAPSTPSSNDQFRLSDTPEPGANRWLQQNGSVDSGSDRSYTPTGGGGDWQPYHGPADDDDHYSKPKSFPTNGKLPRTEFFRRDRGKTAAASDHHHHRVKEKRDSEMPDLRHHSRNRHRKHEKTKKGKIKGSDASKRDDLVPPLRIRSGGVDPRVHPRAATDKSNKSAAGGLKLTLKKQEGSGDYYRVRDGLVGRRYAEMRHGSSDKRDSPAQILSGCQAAEKRKMEARGPDGNLKDVSVILEDCVQVDAAVPLPHHPARSPYDDRCRGGNAKRSKRCKSPIYRDLMKISRDQDVVYSPLQIKENLSQINDFNSKRVVARLETAGNNMRNHHHHLPPDSKQRPFTQSSHYSRC